MVKPVIVKRQVKGSALTFSEQDQNFQNLRDSTISIAVTGSDTVVMDLNDTTTLVATDGISITAVSSSQSIEFDASLVNDLTPQLGGDLDAQNENITDVSGVTFNTITEQNHSAGRIYWDPVDGTLAVGMEYDEVVGKVGMNLFYHVKNQTGSTIPKGTFVMAVGTIGASGQILAAPAVTDGTVDPRFMLGITNMEITNGGDGYAVHFGLIKGLDTQGPDSVSDWSDGTVLYPDAAIAGALTDTRPTPPSLSMAVAYVVNAAANGSIFVRSTTGAFIGDLHNVDVTGASDGDVLVYDSSTGVWSPSAAAAVTYAISADSDSLGDVRLTLTGSDLTEDSVSLVASTGMTITRTDANTITFSSTGGAGINNVVDDTTPQLGGNLDVNGYSIVSVSNGNIVITPDGSGHIQLDGLNWPTSDGSTDYVLSTNGSGQLSWADPTTTAVMNSGTNVSFKGGETIYIDGGTGIDTLGVTNDTVVINLSNTAVSAGSYTAPNITIDAQGRITSATSKIYIEYPIVQNIDFSDYLLSRMVLKDYAETIYAGGNSGATITPDHANGNVQTYTLNSATVTINLPSNMPTGGSITLILTQDGTGNRAASWNASYLFAGGDKTLSTGANDIDVVSVFYDGSRYLASLNTDFS